MKLKSQLILSGIAAIILFSMGCNLDPNKAKVRFVENGDKYAAQGKYKEAILLYRNAIRKDPKYGPAYLKLGDAEAKRGQFPSAVAAYRRAADLLPFQEAEGATGKLADIFLVAYAFDPRKNAALLPEIKALSESILKKNPSSFQGLRLQGFLALADEKDPGRFAKALKFFQMADAVKPNQPELMFAMVQVLSASGEWSQSEAKARQIIQQSPAFVNAYNFLFSNYIRRNQMQDAENILNLKIQNNPKVNRFLLDKAAYYWATQRRDEAEKILSSLLEREKESPEIRQDVGQFYLERREYQKAYQIFEAGARQPGDRRTAYRLRMAEAQVQLGRSRDAIAVVDQALKDDPKSTDAASMKAALQLSHGGKDQVQGAINDLQALIGKAPENVVVRFNLAKALQSRGELDAARVQYLEVIKRSKQMTGAHLGLGQLYLLKKDFGRAISSAEEVLKYDPRNLSARLIKANAITGTGNLRLARSEITSYLADAPDSPDLKFHLAVVDFLDNRPKEAEATFRELSQKYPNDLRLTYAIAEVMLRTNRQNDGLRMLLDQLQKSPQDQSVKAAVAGTALRIGQFDLAEKYFRELISVDPKKPDHYVGLGEALRKKGQSQAAVQAFRQARDLAPASPVANLQLAMTLDTIGSTGESLPLYEAVLKAQPDHVIALNNLAFMYADTGRDLDVALTYAQRAKQGAPTNDDVSDTLAWVYIKRKMNDNAITILREITARQPRNPTYHYHMGVALSQKGNNAAARQSLQTALSLKPARQDEARIRELLAKLG
jgi:Flp pilus assembly protein TadD